MKKVDLTIGKLQIVGMYADPHFDVVYPNENQVQQYPVCLTGRLTGGEM